MPLEVWLGERAAAALEAMARRRHRGKACDGLRRASATAALAPLQPSALGHRNRALAAATAWGRGNTSRQASVHCSARSKAAELRRF
jgi:hypothetical protein